jgi:hypothetical protein
MSTVLLSKGIFVSGELDLGFFGETDVRWVQDSLSKINAMRGTEDDLVRLDRIRVLHRHGSRNLRSEGELVLSSDISTNVSGKVLSRSDDGSTDLTILSLNTLWLTGVKKVWDEG